MAMSAFPLPMKSSCLPVGILASTSAPRSIPDPLWMQYFNRSAISPIPVALWSYGTEVVRMGLVLVPPKMCAATPWLA